MEEKYFQNSNGVEKLIWVSETQLNNLARDVEAEEIIGGQTTEVPLKVKGVESLFDENGMLKTRGE